METTDVGKPLGDSRGEIGTAAGSFHFELPHCDQMADLARQEGLSGSVWTRDRARSLRVNLSVNSSGSARVVTPLAARSSPVSVASSAWRHWRRTRA